MAPSSRKKDVQTSKAGHVVRTREHEEWPSFKEHLSFWQTIENASLSGKKGKQTSQNGHDIRTQEGKQTKKSPGKENLIQKSNEKAILSRKKGEQTLETGHGIRTQEEKQTKKSPGKEHLIQDSNEKVSLSQKKCEQTSETGHGVHTQKDKETKKSSGNEMEASSRENGSQSFKTGCVVRTLEKELIKVFGEKHLKPKLVFEVPVLENPPICKDLKELSNARRFELRSAKETRSSDTVSLKKFDPNFLSPKYICCRFPGCRHRKPRSKKKEDLYLCPSHRKSLEEGLEEFCAKRGVDVSKYISEDFEGYTSIIGYLEAIYSHEHSVLYKSRYRLSAYMIKKACIEFRNFLIIVNALLNPDKENLCTALNQPMAMLVETLRILRNDGEVIVQRVRELVDILHEVIEHILRAFGVIYSRIGESLDRNPGAKIGAGIGGFAGMAGFVGSGLVGTFTTIAGAKFGSWIGDGLYEFFYDTSQRIEDNAQKRIRRYQEFAQANYMASQEADPELQDGEDKQGLYYITVDSGDLLLRILI